MRIRFETVPHGSNAWKEAVELRETILRKPLGSAFSADELAEEKSHIHITGYANEELVATAVLVPEAGQMKMQRVVVDNSARNAGIGTDMIRFCEDLAKQHEDVHVMYCHARDSAVRFYAKNGYEPDGDYFPEDGIPHLKMKKRIL